MNQHEDFVTGVHTIPNQLGEKFAALVSTDTKRIFDYEDVKPIPTKNSDRGYVPWGEVNEQPYEMLEKIRADEVMSSNMWFNIRTMYGRGLHVTENGGEVTSPDVKKFFRRNNMVKFWAEQFTDISHFFFSVLVIILDKQGEKIVQVRHREAVNCRFESCNPKNGKIEHVFFNSWQETQQNDDIEMIPLLDEDDPIGDLMVRLGKEIDPYTGRKQNKTTDRIFAIVNRIPTPGQKYYPFPYYASTFNSGWYTLKSMIPTAKVAKMTNGMVIKYLVELHKDYFSKLFESEKITDPKEKAERKKEEVENIKNFLSGIDNQNKSWFSTYYIDPNGKEQKMVRIERVGEEKEGGDYIEDVEEATNIISYSQGVHVSLIGASPGKSKNINGTEARELFTMKQALEKLTRDISTGWMELLNDVNGWNLEFEIPDLMLTTLDQKTDAKEVTQNNDNDDTAND